VAPTSTQNAGWVRFSSDLAERPLSEGANTGGGTLTMLAIPVGS
jgi:hypothetical protein